MKANRCFALLIFCFIVPGTAARAQDSDLAFYQQSASKVVRNARQLVRPVLTDKERSIEQTINVDVTRGEDVAAFARRRSERQIIISGGMVQMLHWFTQAYIVAGELGREKCFEEWGSYATRTISFNSNAVATHNPRRPLYDVFHFQNSQYCQGLQWRDYQRIGDVGRTEAGFMEHSIAFILLHEIGHHVLGHVDGPAYPCNSADTTGCENRRFQESAADAWAVKTAWKARYNLLGAAPAFQMIAYFNYGSLEQERTMDHPLGVKRVFQMYSDLRSTLARDEAFQKQLDTDGTRTEWETDMERTIDQLHSLIK